MKKLITISVIFVVIAACDISERVEADYRNVIPLPHEIVMVDGNSFVVEKDTRILYPEDNVLLERKHHGNHIEIHFLRCAHPCHLSGRQRNL